MAEGRCSQCLTRFPREGKSLCLPCSEYRKQPHPKATANAVMRRRRCAKIADGCCGQCLKTKVEKDGSTCAECRNKGVDLRRKRKDASLCPGCGLPTEAGNAYCFSCQGKHRKWRYRISVEQFSLMKDRQSNACAICGDKFSKTPRVDHNHSKKQVRDLLCAHCNTLLGACRESTNILRRSVDYLERWNETADKMKACD